MNLNLFDVIFQYLICQSNTTIILKPYIVNKKNMNYNKINNDNSKNFIPNNRNTNNINMNNNIIIINYNINYFLSIITIINPFRLGLDSIGTPWKKIFNIEK